ncbi:MAG TPA: hypothetical protein G4O08_13265 [Anaerolineae bacterium]|nr:hypothetical protein [Anaerolineae bacterium]
MSLTIVLAVLALICVMVGGIAATRMAVELRARGENANPLFIRWMIFKYIADYKRITLEETGQVGPLYRTCTNFLGLAGILSVATILTLIV